MNFLHLAINIWNILRYNMVWRSMVMSVVINKVDIWSPLQPQYPEARTCPSKVINALTKENTVSKEAFQIKFNIANIFSEIFAQVQVGPFHTLVAIRKFSFHLYPVHSGHPNRTCYLVFLSIPDPTRFSFGNQRVARNPKHWVLPNIWNKPEVSDTTWYFGYHPLQ